MYTDNYEQEINLKDLLFLFCTGGGYCCLLLLQA